MYFNIAKYDYSVGALTSKKVEAEGDVAALLEELGTTEEALREILGVDVLTVKDIVNYSCAQNVPIAILPWVSLHDTSPQGQVHELKTVPESWEQIDCGNKTFECRFDDRGFAVGDVLVLKEWFPAESRYSGRECTRQVTYIARGGEGVFAELGCLAPGWVCMSIKRMWF